MTQDRETLQMALAGYKLTRDQLDEKIAGLKRQLAAGNGRAGRSAALRLAQERPARKPLSKAARERIAAAQRKRWKEFNAKRAEAQHTKAKRKATPPPAEKTMTAGG